MLIKLKLPERKETPYNVHTNKYVNVEYNQAISEVESLNQPLVRGIEIDVEAFAKEMFEICTFPEPTTWEELGQQTQYRWKINAEIIRDNAHVWLKEKDSK